jgi:hypothetical protein
MLFSIECQCEGAPINPGQPGCVPIVGRDKFPIFFEYTNSDGDLNGVPAGTVLNEAFLIAKLNETDQTKRWYVFPEMFNIASPSSENETEDIDGVPVPTGEEIKQTATFEHVGKDANPALKASYDSIKCEDLGVIFGTYQGQLNGMSDGAGNLVGIHIKSGTLSAQYMAPAKGTVQKMMVSYLVDDLENDANRDFIASSSIEYPVKNWFTNQPLEIIPLEVSSAVAAATFSLNSLYGLANKKSPITGIVTTDISPDLGVTTGEAYNFTQASNEPGTLTESGTTPGLYTFTYTAPVTVADVVHIDIFKSGYHMKTLVLTAAV